MERWRKQCGRQTAGVPVLGAGPHYYSPWIVPPFPSSGSGPKFSEGRSLTIRPVGYSATSCLGTATGTRSTHTGPLPSAPIPAGGSFGRLVIWTPRRLFVCVARVGSLDTAWRTGFSDKLSRDGFSGHTTQPRERTRQRTRQRSDRTVRQRLAFAGPLQAAREFQRVRDRLGDARRAGRFAGVAPDADMPAADALPGCRTYVLSRDPPQHAPRVHYAGRVPWYGRPGAMFTSPAGCVLSAMRCSYRGARYSSCASQSSSPWCARQGTGSASACVLCWYRRGA